MLLYTYKYRSQSYEVPSQAAILSSWYIDCIIIFILYLHVDVCLKSLSVDSESVYICFVYQNRSVYLVLPAQTQIAVTAGTTVNKGTHPIINIRHN